MKSYTIQFNTDIYAYTDYRKFLKHWYDECKLKYSFFSLRYIQRKIGYKSPAFFSQIIHNQTRISLDTAFKFSRFLKLNQQKASYFNLLVSYDNAKDPNNKMVILKQINSFKRAK